MTSSNVVLKQIFGYQTSSPQLFMTIFLLGFPLFDPHCSILLTTSIPCTTCPKTTCFPSNQSVRAVVMKNCEPLLFGPELAIDSNPGTLCFRMKFSSSNLRPYIERPPVPSWLVKSPPCSFFEIRNNVNICEIIIFF